MSTLTGNKISLTYKSLIKTADNDVLGAVLKELSDGLGNNSGVFLNTGGDLKSTGTLEFSNFKATAYAVTINKLVNEADGISNNDNDTSLPTSAAVKDYVDTHVTSQDLDFSDGTNVGAVDLDSQVLAIVGTSNEIETAASGQQLQIGLPNDVTISGTFFATEFQGAFAGTINSGTTAVTQTAGDNSTKVATTAYVDTLDAASDLDFSDGSVSSAVNLNTQVFSIQGTSNEITTTASGQSLTIALDSTGVDLPDGSTAITQTAGDNSTKVATTAYVDTLDAASDLDIAGDTGTGDVNLNTQTLTLQGTTNQVITAVSGQTTTFSLPSTVHRDLQGNVTGNADTATAWQTARDLSISGEATGTLSSVDGTGNVSGAVTLTNSAVTGKVLTGLPTPAAATVQPSDSILEGIGKLQSQINGIANGLQFQGTWDAATNTPTLNSGGGEVDSGTTTGQTANKLIDSSQNFLTTVSIGDKVINQVDGQSALVTNVDSNTSLTLDADIMLSGEAYTIDASPFLVQGHYYVVSVGGTTSLNGNANWAVGDWVIAGADNVWSKLDHTQIDGQGTPGNLPVWNTATTLTDSIVSESGTALTVTGSLSTTLGASVTGDFAVNTNKFTVNATSGDAVIAGNLNFPDDKRIRLGTSNAFQIYYDSAAQSGQGEATITTGGHTKIESSFFKVGSSTKTAIAVDANNYVRLYHSGNQKLATTGTGVDITGAINADSATFAGDVLADKLVVDGASNGNVSQLALTRTDFSWGIFNETDLRFYVQSGNTTTPNTQVLQIGTTGNATFAGQVIASSSSSGDYVRMYGGSGTAQWDIYGNGENLRISENSGGGGHVDIDTNLVVDGNAGIGTQTLNTISGTNPTLTLGGTSISGGLILQRAGTDKARLYENADNMVHQGMTGVGHHFYVNAATQAMVIDSSGYVGIGVTPAAHYGGYEVLDIGNSLSLISNNTSTNVSILTNNAYLNSGATAWVRKAADEATMYEQVSGEHRFSNAGSAAAGVAISWSEIMRLKTPGSTIQDVALQLKTTGASDNAGIMFINSGNTSSFNDIAGIASFVESGSAKGNLQFWTRNSDGDNSDVATRMTINSSGIVRIFTSGGTSEKTYSAAAGLELYSQQSDSGYPYTKTSDIVANGDGTVPSELRMFTKASGSSTPTERMRITSGGTVKADAFAPLDSSTSVLDFATDNVIKLFTSSTEKMRIESDGTVRVKTGSIVVDTSGQGIYLGGTATANNLDYYEEGTWTPEVSAPTTGSGVTYNYRGGTYVRIGNKCWVRMGLNVSSVGTGFSGVLYVTGLPFTSANVGAYQEPTSMAMGGRWVSSSNAGNVYAFVQNSQSRFVFRTMASNADTPLDFSQLQGGNAATGTWFTMQCFYEIA